VEYSAPTIPHPSADRHACKSPRRSTPKLTCAYNWSRFCTGNRGFTSRPAPPAPTEALRPSFKARALYPQGVQVDSPVTFSRFELERAYDAHCPWRLESGILSESRVRQSQYLSHTLISRYKSSGLAGRLKYYHFQSVHQRTGRTLPSGNSHPK
jgi:hypothetical protein